MKLVPLNVKKWISKQLHRVGFMTATVIGAVSFLGGIGGMLFYQEYGGPGEAKEKIVMQEKVDHLLKTYKMSESMHLLVQAEGKGQDVALVLPKAQEKDKTLRAAFEAEAQATAIALAHERHLSPKDEFELYKKLGVIDPLPDYFKKTRMDNDNTQFCFLSYAQHRVMNRPGFTPTIETAREIVSHIPDNVVLPTMACVFLPSLLTAGMIFGYSAGRKRLDTSIRVEEKAIEQAQLAAEKAEKKALRAQRIAAAARAKAEEAERQRLANLPVAVATALENDISVRQIKLAPREQRPGI